MSILLVLIAALASSDQQCAGSSGVRECSETVLALADTSVMLPVDERRHIADVRPPVAAAAEVSVAVPAPTSKPQPPEQPPEPMVTASPDEPAAPPEPAPETQPKAVPSLAPPELNEPWAVQIAAFGDRDSAEQGVLRIGLENIVIVPTRRDGEDWFVLLLGTYPSQDSAEAAGRSYVAETGGSYWVRNASGLNSIQSSEDDPSM